MKKKISIIIALLLLFLMGCQTNPIDTIANQMNNKTSKNDTIKIGWVSELSGRSGGIEAAKIAIEEINNEGGVSGKKIELIVEDGKSDANAAAAAALKLINKDKVHFILGGSNSPESMAIAPIAEANKVIMLAITTTSPYLTDAGDYIFRTSPSTNKPTELIAHYLREKNIKRVAIIYEQTSYARPMAEKMKNIVEQDSGVIVANESYEPGKTDFKASLARIKEANPEAIFLSPQSTDTTLLFMEQLRELGISAKLFGNDTFGIQAMIDENPSLFEGVIFYDIPFDTTNEKTATFIEKYKKAYNVQHLPYGPNTAIAYDTTYILVNGLRKCGENVECIKEDLYSVKEYDGTAGKISIDNNGDGVLDFVPKTIENGKVVDYIEDFRIYSK